MEYINQLRIANAKFATDIYKVAFPQTADENLVFSPFCLHSALAMLGLAAEGNTRYEIFDGIHLNAEDLSDDLVAWSYGSILSDFLEKGDQFLTMANGAYLQKPREEDGGYRRQVRRRYVDIVKGNFGAELELLDFRTVASRGDAVTRINRWVEGATGQKIVSDSELLGGGQGAGLVLVCGVAFKPRWLHPFKSCRTQKAPFRLPHGGHVVVDMMLLTSAKLPYGELPELDATAVVLPCRSGGRFSLVIVLPNSFEDGLARINQHVAGTRGLLQGGLTSIIRQWSVFSPKVDVSLPKFRVEGEIEDLSGILSRRLGMRDMFSWAVADFGILEPKKNDDHHPFVHSVIHKATLEVDEGDDEIEGQPSAFDILMDYSVQTTHIPFTVDRPFYFQVVDHSHGDLVLFAGHCNDPTL